MAPSWNADYTRAIIFVLQRCIFISKRHVDVECLIIFAWANSRETQFCETARLPVSSDLSA